MTQKMAVLCNHADASGIMPTLIMASSGLSLDYEVLVFFCPGGAQALVKGELEKHRGLKGLPIRLSSIMTSSSWAAG
jgi:peroxiredoxin family protein